MHELSILVEVVKTVENICKEQQADKVAKIVLQVGELSAVVPEFLREYYPVVILDKPLFENSALEIETLPGEAACSNCGTVFNVIENKGFCPNCNSFEKELLCGKEFFIKEIAVIE